MAKYHIAADGKPAICKAKIQCRLGGTHYDTREAAKVASLQANVTGLLTKPVQPQNQVGNFPVLEGEVKDLLLDILTENNDEETWASLGMRYSASKHRQVQDFILWPNETWNGPDQVLESVNILEEFVNPEMEYSDEDGNEHPYLQHELLRGKAIAWVRNVKSQLNHTKAPTPEPKLDPQKWPVDSSGAVPRENPRNGNIEYQLPSINNWTSPTNLHREDGPAVTQPDGTQRWMHTNRRHRLDGPAVVRKDGTREFWVNGLQVRDEKDYPLAASSYIPQPGEKDLFEKK